MSEFRNDFKHGGGALTAEAFAAQVDYYRKMARDETQPVLRPSQRPPIPVWLYDRIVAIRAEHESHVEHDPSCVFCCGDVT